LAGFGLLKCVLDCVDDPLLVVESTILHTVTSPGTRRPAVVAAAGLLPCTAARDG
jgi:hypothetical protein